MIDNLWLWVILAGLANYKAARMISQDGEDGPFNIFLRFRAWVGVETWVGKGVHCFSCTSFWGAMIATLLLAPAVTWNLWLLIWGAIAGLSLLVWRYFG